MTLRCSKIVLPTQSTAAVELMLLPRGQFAGLARPQRHRRWALLFVPGNLGNDSFHRCTFGLAPIRADWRRVATVECAPNSTALGPLCSPNEWFPLRRSRDTFDYRPVEPN